MEGEKWFSTLHLKNEYWHVTLHPDDKGKTAFYTGQGAVAVHDYALRPLKRSSIV
jgi:hypothetical protein